MATNKLILSTEEVITATLKVISATTKVILATEEVIITTLKVISATTKVILATEEVTTATLKVLSAIAKVLFVCDHFHFESRCGQDHFYSGRDNFQSYCNQFFRGQDHFCSRLDI